MGRKRRNSNDSGIWKFITVVLAIVSVLLLFGIWLDKEKKNPELKTGEDALEDKIKRRAEIKERIEELKPQREALLHKERKYFLWARISIGVLLLSANVAYWLIANKCLEIGAQVDFNGAILLGYSFIAFIISGTPTRFAKTIRLAVIRRLRKKQVHIFMELEMWEKAYQELDRIIKEEQQKKKT